MACASSGCSLAWVAGKASAALTARLTLSTIAFGVPAGATMPVQELAMKLGTPSSAMVGTSGRSASRFDDGVPSGRNFLSRNCGNRTSPAQINNKCDQARHPPHSNPFCGAQVCRKKFHWKHVSWQDALTLFLIKIKFLKIGAFVNSGPVLTCTESPAPISTPSPDTPRGWGRHFPHQLWLSMDAEEMFLWCCAHATAESDICDRNG